nr:MAG TPA: hypothetical protein [Caudoviricetes sp.]
MRIACERPILAPQFASQHLSPLGRFTGFPDGRVEIQPTRFSQKEGDSHERAAQAVEAILICSQMAAQQRCRNAPFFSCFNLFLHGIAEM